MLCLVSQPDTARSKELSCTEAGKGGFLRGQSCCAATTILPSSGVSAAGSQALPSASLLLGSTAQQRGSTSTGASGRCPARAEAVVGGVHTAHARACIQHTFVNSYTHTRVHTCTHMYRHAYKCAHIQPPHSNAVVVLVNITLQLLALLRLKVLILIVLLLL